MSYAVLGCRCLIVLVFAVSGLSKISSRAAFRDLVTTLRNGHQVPARLCRATAVTVVALELAIVTVLLTGPGVSAGFVGAAALLTVFIGATAVVIRRHTYATCQCFGEGNTPLGYPHLVRNVLLVIVASLGLWAQQTGPTPANHPAGIAMALCAGAVLAALLIRFDDLVDLFSAAPS